MKIGTYYYPEQWPREQWKRDFETMADMDMQLVHMGEFAWFEMEAWPGEIRLDWLEECVDHARQHKMQVILCTPTAAPPIWLVRLHPEILPVDDAGRRARFGGRRHYSPTAPALHHATRRIVTALAERFRDNPTVIGWQIDNEFSGPGYFDQNDHAHAAFRDWLRRKYPTIAHLNVAWGNQFWNSYYTDFEQVSLPPSADQKYGNPHHLLDARRFWSWAYAQFSKMQADILHASFAARTAPGPKPFVTTNFFNHPDINPADFAGDLDVMTWDSYPVHGQDKGPGERFRIGNPTGIGLSHDAMAAHNGRFGVMELQPGQVNWGDTPNLLYPGAVRLWLWTAFAHGAEFVTTYRFRQPRFGCEMFHHGLVGTDGITPSPGGRQFTQVIEEIARLDPAKVAEVPTESSPASPQSAIGLLFDFEQTWWAAALRQSRRWDTMGFARLWYSAIARLGRRVAVVHPGSSWANLPMIVVPGVQMVDDDLVKRLDEYASAGGHMVLTCRTGLMDRNGQMWEGPTAKPILPLIGGAIEAYDGLPGELMGKVDLDGKLYSWGAWGELLYAEPDTKVLARYADQFYASAAAVMQKKHGQGTVTYCGVWGEQAFADALLERLVLPPAADIPSGMAKRRRAKGEPPALPQASAMLTLSPRTQLLRRGAYSVFLNYQDTPVQAPAPAGARFLVGAASVEPAGVAVWEG